MQPAGTPSDRPPLITAAAITLFVAGALNLLGAFLLFGVGGGLGMGLGLLSLLIGAASIYAGVQVLALREQGRVIALAIAGVGAVLGLMSIVQGNPYQILSLLLYGFILFALLTQAAAFRRA